MKRGLRRNGLEDPDYDPSILKLKGTAFLDAMSERNGAWRAEADPDFDLPSLLERLRATGRPAILLRPSAPADPEARSWFGGLPRLPPELEWPEIEGRPLSFLAELDLADAPRVEDSLLPAEGVLYVFARLDLEEDVGESGRVRVLYHPGSVAGLPERAPPPGLPRLDAGSLYHPFAWLEDDEPLARIDAKHSIAMQAFTSYDPYFPPPDEQEEWNDTQSAEYEDAVFELSQEALGPGPEPVAGFSDFGGARDADWPQSWRYVEHAARGLVFLLTRYSTYSRASWPPSGLALSSALTGEAGEWRARAAADPDSALPRDHFERFRAWWASVQSRSDAVRQASDGASFSIGGRVEAIALQSARVAFLQTCSMGGDVPEAVAVRFRAATRRPETHQMLGYGVSAQEGPLEHAEDVLLLQISGDSTLSAFNTGCVLHLWIRPEELAARRFDRVTATFECD
jgi:hypothetical protein